MKERSEFFSKELTDEERELYDRQFRLEGWSQKIVKNSRILIIGVGGLGCEIAKNLAMLGVGHLDLVDLDIIEHSNLNRQLLFAGAEMGAPKALVGAERLSEINPNIEIKGYHTSLEQVNPILYKKADVVIGGLDSMNARLNLNAQCIRFKKPLVDGGVSGYYGHTYTVFPYENACYECNPLPVGESEEMAACTVVGIPRKRIHCVFKGSMAFEEEFDREPNPQNLEDMKFIKQKANELVEKHDFYPYYTESDIVQIIDRHDPGIITINAAISAFQSHEAMKILHWNSGNKGLGEPVKTYVIFNAVTMKIYHIEKNRNPDCLQCGEHVRRVSVKMKKDYPCSRIVDILEQNGFQVDPEFEPTLTVMDFNNIKVVDLDKTPQENELRNYELITAAGFREGEIFVTLKLH
ncbi:MAG: ThiF family adenylyltransferase [Promethearchaeia archaeon]